MTLETVSEIDLFECKKCGDCCKGYGGTFLSPEDITAISNYIGENPESFAQRYCQLSGGRPVLSQGENGYCIFWDDQCSIHPVKPHMCKAWPFINAVLVDIANWHIMAKSCPGIRADIPEDMVLEYVKKKFLK